MGRIRILILIGFALSLLPASDSAADRQSAALVSITPELPLSGTAKPGAGKFLVAKRALDGSYFGETVIYLAEHDEQGTMGLIVNRSSEYSLGDAVPDIDGGRAEAHRLYYGGPVEPSVIFMLMRSRTATRGMAHIDADVYISADRGILEDALAAGKTAGEIRCYFGYAGWAAGQLDSEIRRGSWHVMAGDARAIFSAESDSLWQWLIERLEPEGIQVRGKIREDSLMLASGKTGRDTRLLPRRRE